MAMPAEDAQINRFREYVRSLNEQFARWVVQQWENKTDRFWCHGMIDYLRHSVIIRRDHAEALAALEARGQGEYADRKPHEAQLTIMPLHHAKIVHFVRHGEGFHNIGIVNEDAQLTELGWRQAEALHAHVAGLQPPLDLQVVITSPMWRALETAAAVFGAGPWRRRSRVLMHGQAGTPNLRAAHAAIAAPEGLPFVAFEGCRERLGAAACDRRRDIAAAVAAFPGVDFSHIEPGRDIVYEQHRIETEHAVQERGAKFLQWLMARPEQRIAVVTHCGFLFLTLSAFGHECAPAVQEELHRGFDNCELRSMVFTDAAGGGRGNPTWFPGGRACAR